MAKQTYIFHVLIYNDDSANMLQNVHSLLEDISERYNLDAIGDYCQAANKETHNQVYTHFSKKQRA
jgi:predicted metal-dependent enzyme (double-stranded beta helix superfamily)